MDCLHSSRSEYTTQITSSIAGRRKRVNKMPYMYCVTDEQLSFVRSALYDSSIEYKRKLKEAMEAHPLFCYKVYRNAARYFRAERALAALEYECKLPIFSSEEMKYDGSELILAAYAMEPVEE